MVGGTQFSINQPASSGSKNSTTKTLADYQVRKTEQSCAASPYTLERLCSAPSYKIKPPAFLKDISPKAIEFVAAMEAHNFAHADPIKNSSFSFKNRLSLFIKKCQQGKQKFSQQAFHRFLGARMSERFLDMREAYNKIKHQKRFDLIKEFLPQEGKSLDHGCGDLRFAKLVSKETKLEAHGADVLDMRHPSTSDVTFHKVESNTKLADCKDNEFNATTMVYVLHHVDPENLQELLKEIKRVNNGKILVIEDVYGFKAQDTENLCKLSKQFAQLDKKTQLEVLKLTDYLRNIIIKGVEEMNVPFEFKTIKEWHDTFETAGFNIIDTNTVGYQSDQGYSHANFNVAFSLSCQ